MTGPGREDVVEITRTFDAPRERVFDAWTQGAHLMRWFGPKDFKVESCEAAAVGDGDVTGTTFLVH